MTLQFHTATLAQMSPETLYDLLKLRTDVFVVEQQCAYPELDGRDRESDAVMLWGEDEGSVIATLRVLHDATTLRIGRVAVDPQHRGTGVARELFERGLQLCAEIDPARAVVLDAQEPLETWYGQFGFVRAGDVFIEDGIPHIPMTRAATALS